MKTAACIGNQFELDTLAVVCEGRREQIATDLWPALKSGLVIPETENYRFFQGNSGLEVAQNELKIGYRFLHDRVQQVAYSLIPEEQKQTRHWQMGQLLLQKRSVQGETDHLFEIVNHLNQGRSGSLSLTEQGELAEWNLQAGEKAKRSAAYPAAQTYCEMGLQLMSISKWQTDYDLMYRLHYQGAESAYLSGDYDQAERLYANTLSHARSTVEQAAIYRLQMTQYQLQGRNAEAIEIQRQSLKLLG